MQTYVVKWTEVVEYWCEVEANTPDEAIKVSEWTPDGFIDNEVMDAGKRTAELLSI